MSVYKRGSGRYQVLIDLEPTALGGRLRKALGCFRTRKLAEAVERKALEARDRGCDLSPQTVTVRELWKSTRSVAAPRRSQPRRWNVRGACKVSSSAGHRWPLARTAQADARRQRPRESSRKRPKPEERSARLRRHSPKRRRDVCSMPRPVLIGMPSSR